MLKTSIQISLLVVFSLLLIVCVAGYLLRENSPSGLGAIIAVLGGCTIVAALLPQLSEISVSLKGVSAKLIEQQREIDTLKFLVTGYVTNFELEHLKKLAALGAFPFRKGDTFCEELRRLWRHGLIEKCHADWYIGQLPESGNLKDFLLITERGKTYLRLLRKVESERADQ